MENLVQPTHLETGGDTIHPSTQFDRSRDAVWNFRAALLEAKVPPYASARLLRLSSSPKALGRDALGSV